MQTICKLVVVYYGKIFDAMVISLKHPGYLRIFLKNDSDFKMSAGKITKLYIILMFK